MAEYIDRQAALDELRQLPHEYANKEQRARTGGIAACQVVVRNIPPADVRPVRRGKWTDHRTIEHDGEWWCTACGKEITIYMGADRKDRYAFCPNCGAWMEDGD